ncbi:hypothetical protein AWC38_SpisGene14308 [Stylophora pistillata]|uniref:Endonuclease/exonuclease/phosphatase domain-containing protein n=1 Tax=Stylophora pistillata TaxID=50429 RepID=A0A2B4RVN3_STYPI|nr:hypothetical protein AWC38_SpisGene14308 [Stylophora pistillata]
MQTSHTRLATKAFGDAILRDKGKLGYKDRSEKVNKPTEFISSLSSAIELMFKCRQEIILKGDYNLDMLVNEDEGRRENKALKDLCDRFCLFNQITEPTRITEKSQSLIEVTLASHPERFATSGKLHLRVSDHDLVLAVRQQKTPRPNAREIEYRSIKNLDVKEPLEELTRVTWDSAYTFEDVDDLWDHWAKLYCGMWNKHAPLKKQIGSEVTSCRGSLLNYNVKFLGEIDYSRNTLEIQLIPLGKDTVDRGTKLLYI